MGPFLQRHKLPKLTEEKKNNPKSTVSVEEIKFIVKNVSTKKSPGYGGFGGEAYQSFKEE